MSDRNAAVPPRILHAKFAAYLGWSQPFLHRLISGLGRSVPVSVLCARIENRERFPIPDTLRARTRALVFPGTAALLAGHLHLTRNPKLIHAHFGWSGLRVLLLKPFLGVPLVTTFGGRDAGTDYADPLLRPVYEVLVRQSEVMICVSDGLRRDLEARGAPAERLVVVRRGTDVDFFEPQQRDGPDRGKELRVLMVGRLVEKKAHANAIEAIRSLQTRGVAARLRIVGEGKERESLERLVGELGLGRQVELAGKTDRAGVLAHMAWADAFVQCSVTTPEGDREGIPNVVVEAAATGLPVIGTRHGGIPETMEEGRTGLLVDEGDVADLASSLESLARSADHRRAMGDRAALHVRQHLTEESQLRAHLDLYAALDRGEIAPCAAPPEDLPTLLQRAFGYDDLGCDHRTLRAAQEVRGCLARPRDAEVGESPRLASPSLDKPPLPRRTFDALPEPWKVGARAAAHRLLPGWIERRRERHYRWVASRQRGLDDQVWRQAMDGGAPPRISAARSTALLETLVQESDDRERPA